MSGDVQAPDAAVRESRLLRGHGRLPWPEVSALLEGWQAFWCDLDGPHLGDPPAGAPAYTHLWAWRGADRARVRIDGQHGIVGMLLAEGDESGTAALLADEVVVSVGRGQSWTDADPRIAHDRGELPRGDLEITIVEDIAPITFLAVLTP